MAYDALDRLLSAASPIFGNNTTGTATFSYDALDNLTNLAMPATNTRPARNQFYCYDANWRLSSLRDADGCAGTAQVNLAWDAQGNLASKGSQTFAFGKNNRLYAAPAHGEVYRYDAQGHRVLQNAAAGNILSQYARDGQLLQVTNVRSGFTSSYVSLGGSLVAVRKKALSGGAITVEYQHTDALGTPVAVTDANRNVIERSEYEPYGQLLNRPITDGPGFTGHVQDALTGLTYMQQRYFDPMSGRFLSVDPVTAYSNPVGAFNRYDYAGNNPYRFTDPDGRLSKDRVWKGRDWSSLSAHSSNGLTAPGGRQFTSADVTQVKSFDPHDNSPIPFAPEEKRDSRLDEASTKVVKALNRALEVSRLKKLAENMRIADKLKVFLSQETIGNSQAFVADPHSNILVFNMEPMIRIWDVNLTGLGLHEIHHFSQDNITVWELTRGSSARYSPTNSPWGQEAYDYQATQGFPRCLGHLGCDQ